MAFFLTTMKKASACMAALCLGALIAFAAAGQAYASEVVQSGDCGPSSHWTVDADNNVVISGTGDVCKTGYSPYRDNKENFSYFANGGTKYVYMRHVATSITVEEGITSIDASVFNNYLNLESVSLPASLESIGANAFYNCRNLIDVTLSTGSCLKSVGDGAFSNCTSLKSLNLYAAKSLSSIGTDVLSGASTEVAVKKAAVAKGRKLTVTWNAVPGATSYQLFYRKAGGKYASVKLAGSTTSKTLAKLTVGKKYQVYVVAKLGTSTLSKSAVKTTAKIKK